MLVLVGVVAALGAVWSWNREAVEDFLGLGDRRAEAELEVSDPPESPEEKSVLAIDAVDRFLAATSIGERLELVFDLRVEAPEVEEYYLGRRRVDPTPEGRREVTAILEGGREILVVTFRDQTGRDWAAPVEWHGTGYRLHWGAMTGYGELPWSRFLDKPRDEKWKMRVNIYRPSDRSIHRVPGGYEYVLLTHPELETPLGALLAPDPSLQPLQELPTDRDIPVRVEMIWQDFGDGGEWPVVTSLIHRNWIR